MDNTLEKQIDRSVKVRETIAGILTKNFPIEQDLAELIAFDATNQAIGVKKIRKHSFKKGFFLVLGFVGTVFVYLYNLIGEIVGAIFDNPDIAGFIALLIFIVVFAILACKYMPTIETYPRAYKKDESYRFSKDYKNQQNFVCLGSSYGTIRDKDCLHLNKIDELNQVLDTSVKENKEGIIWTGANGNGEIWEIERNNYRFVVKAVPDPNYK